VRINDHQPLRTRGNQGIGEDPGADRLAAVAAAVLAGVAEVRHDRSQPIGARPTTSVEQEQQLDDVLAHRRARRLDQVHVVAADVGDVWMQLPVGKPCDLARGRLARQHGGYGSRQRNAGGSRHDPQRHSGPSCPQPKTTAV
jgi:hypothetical protein